MRLGKKFQKKSYKENNAGNQAAPSAEISVERRKTTYPLYLTIFSELIRAFNVCWRKPEIGRARTRAHPAYTSGYLYFLFALAGTVPACEHY